MTLRIWSTLGFKPHPFNPHIFRRLAIASGTTTSPIHARLVDIDSFAPPCNSPQVSIIPNQNTPAAGAGNPSKNGPSLPFSAATLKRANRYAAATATPKHANISHVIPAPPSP